MTDQTTERVTPKATTCDDCWDGKHHYCIAYYGGACPCEPTHSNETVAWVNGRCGDYPAPCNHDPAHQRLRDGGGNDG